ncbi:MAG TPA: hypothetical protein VGD03_09975, partial [Frankiaceae bacterium]
MLRRRPGAAALVIAAGLALLGATQASAGTTATGQVTTGSVLAANAATLSGSAAGWTGYGATVGYSPAGHAAPGSLAVTSGGAWTGGVSPQFAVTPGTRYTATGWARSAAPLAPVTVLTSLGSALRVRAVAPHAVGLALRFRNGAGSLIGTGTQIGQGLTDSTTAWTQLAPVVGFAPAGAVKAEVLFLTLDAPKGETHLFDDLSVRATTGTAAKLVGPLTTRGTAVYDATGA